jgi:lipoprotein-releasing system ATP-binding protein
LNFPATHPIELREVAGTCSDGTGVQGISAIFQMGRLHFLRGSAETGRAAVFRFAGLLERPTAGEVLVDGASTAGLSEEARTELRAQRFGFVFSAPFLLDSFTVIENVAMPLFKISHASPEEARRRTVALLECVELVDYAEAAIEEVSTSAQYAVAVARGLVNQPAALMIENIDGVLRGIELEQYLALLRRIATKLGVAIIATASPDLIAQPGDRLLEVADGLISRDSETLREACE